QSGGDGSFHARDDDIEIIERAEPAEADGSALRGIRIDVVELLEARRIFQFAEQREAVAPDLVIRTRRGGCGDLAQRIDKAGGSNESGSAAAQKGPAGKLHGMAPKVVAPTVFAELCQVSGASTDALTVSLSRATADGESPQRTRGAGHAPNRIPPTSSARRALRPASARPRRPRAWRQQQHPPPLAAAPD